ncbi:NAD-dependent epimerase/dehydratase family protein [Nakamurella lactea]|uniref:NAD-dependent epimerase/dehydratase family protein n=1 Tax=Nakamurella lactea TaxID=459515 RepID=UPI0004244C97|nr:NAD(P)-dependent oxidoreductase [Nakamurella lactea]
MRILLAGGTGVLGRRAGALLVDAGHEVWASTRWPNRTAALSAAGQHPVLMDALEPDSADRAVAESEPDLVLHLLTDLAGDDFAANARLRVEGTANLVAAARRHGVTRMVAESLSWVYRPGPGAAGENEPLARNPDGEPAYRGVELLEQAVLALPGGLVLRFGLLYGPDTWYAPGGSAFVAAAAGSVTATTDHTSFVQVDDAAEAAAAAINWPPGVVNVVDDEPTRLQQWGPALVAAAGGDPERATFRASAPGRSASNALASSLGWRLRHPSWSATAFDTRPQ